MLDAAAVDLSYNDLSVQALVVASCTAAAQLGLAVQASRQAAAVPELVARSLPGRSTLAQVLYVGVQVVVLVPLAAACTGPRLPSAWFCGRLTFI